MHTSSRYVKWVPFFSAHFQARGTTLPGVDREEISRRLRAARALAVPTDEELATRKRPVVGITVEELAARVAQDGLGAKTIGNMERGVGPALRPQLREIAEACGVPYEFFTVDLALLGPQQEELGVEERLATLEDFIRSEVVPLLAVQDEAAISELASERSGESSDTAAPARTPQRRAGRSARRSR